MRANEEKRMAGNYEIIHALHIGDREIVLGENPADVGDERYKLLTLSTCEYSRANGRMVVVAKLITPEAGGNA